MMQQCKTQGQTMPCFGAAIFFCLVLISSTDIYGQGSDKSQKIEPVAPKLGRPTDFNKDIQPIIDDKCVACHNVSQAESKLILEDVASILKGGKRGPAVVPKDVAKSLLYQVAARAAEPAMPPLPNKASATAVTPEELGLFKQWIEEGANQGAGTSQNDIPWRAIPSGRQPIYGVAVSAWGRWAACGRANQVDLYDVTRGEHVARLQDPALVSIRNGDQPEYPQGAAHRDFVHAVAFNPEGTLLATAGYREVKLWQRSTSVPRGIYPQDQTVTSVAVSPDGNWIAMGRGDNSLVLQSLTDANVRVNCVGHAGPVTAVQFASDSSRLFSGSADKTIRVWTVSDGQQTGLLTTPFEVTCLALNLDETRVYSGHWGDNVIRGWSVPFEMPKPIEGDKPAEAVNAVLELKGNEGTVSAVALVPPAGNQLVSASADSTWRVWDLTSGTQLRSQNHGAAITSLSVKNDGQIVVTSGANNRVRLWKIDGTAVADLKGSVTAGRRLAVLNDDNAVAKSRVQLADASFKSAEKNLKEREEATKKANEVKATAEKALAEAKPKLESAMAAAESAKNELTAKPEDEALKKKKADADVATTKELEAVKKLQEAVDSAAKGVAQSAKGQFLGEEQRKQAKQHWDDEIHAAKEAEDALNQAKVDQAVIDAKPVKSAVYVADGKLIATAGEDGAIHLWNGTNGKPLEELAGQKLPIGRLAAGPNRMLVAASDDKQVILWDANPAWNWVATLGPPAENIIDLTKSQFANRVLAVAFSSDGKLLATGGGEPSRSGELMLWNIESRSVVRRFADAHSDTVFSVDFSRDGKYLVSGAADKFVKQFEVESGKHVRSFEGHTHHVLGVTWKGDGSRIASAGADNAIKVWNVENGEQLRTIQHHTKQVTAIHFIGVTDDLISSSGDKTVKMHRSNDGANFRTFTGSNDYVHAVEVTRDESLVVAGGEDGVLRIWNGTNAQELFKFDVPKLPAKNTQASVR